MQQTMIRPARMQTWRIPEFTISGGAVAGLLSGCVMVVLSPLLAMLTGISPWAPAKYLAATVLGPAVIAQAGFPLVPVLLGSLLYVAAAVVLGGIFGVVYGRVLRLTTDFGLAIYSALAYGPLLAIAIYFGLLPIVNPTIVAAGAGMGAVLAQTTVFTSFLGLCYTLLCPRPYRWVALRS